jgi:DNA-binding response OmpR family regulator
VAIKILIIDDNPKTLELLSEHLRRAGYEVFTASDYDWALYRFRAALPDLMILDICFPHSERLGLDILKAIRIDLTDQTTPLLMLTGVDKEELEPMSFDLWNLSYLNCSNSSRLLASKSWRNVGSVE